jgi:hypothetical protein
MDGRPDRVAANSPFLENQYNQRMNHYDFWEVVLDGRTHRVAADSPFLMNQHGQHNKVSSGKRTNVIAEDYPKPVTESSKRQSRTSYTARFLFRLALGILISFIGLLATIPYLSSVLPSWDSQSFMLPSWHSQNQTLRMATLDALICFSGLRLLAEGIHIVCTAGRKFRDPARSDEVVVDTVERTILGLTTWEWVRVIMVGLPCLSKAFLRREEAL